MSYIEKPRIYHPEVPRNALGLAKRDYEGSMSTLCSGCGHDSITGALVQAFFELNIEPYKVVKTSGIGCSSKTPTYFLKEAHGFNSVHGRMPSVTTGAYAANHSLNYIGVSGDGDSLSIGFGQFSHAIRRNINMLYIIENNGVYGLTKGQFSASADKGSKSKGGVSNEDSPIDAVSTALGLGATFVARCFSGDKAQLIPILKAALCHRGFALIDIISPCVTFNNHEGSTKSYDYSRKYMHEAVHTDFVMHQDEITAEYDEGDVHHVTMHDGSKLLLRKTDAEYSATDVGQALSYVREHYEKGEVVTGLLYINESTPDFHESHNTTDTPLVDIPFEKLSPGSEALDALMQKYK